ncbi:MAG: hypothetical protein JNK02_01460 [Planctomycetes bacterium]|nr:hypothetical protein [Planctomycetota bacterium]
MNGGRGWALALLLAGVSASCSSYNRWPFWSTQRHPEPMQDALDPLPPGAHVLYPEGPEEVLVVRHADPVRVRPAGRAGGYPLAFHTKNARLHAGSSVSVSPGGRAEVLWDEGSSILLSDRGFGLVGSPSRGEPLFTFLEVDSAWIMLSGEEQIGLVGGSRLSASSGPIALKRVRPDVLRVRNQSKVPARIAFREDVIQLEPGQAVDLPLLAAGGGPLQSATSAQAVPGPGFTVRVTGAVDTDADRSRVRVVAAGEHEVQGLGQRVRLDRGESVDFAGFGPR